MEGIQLEDPLQDQIQMDWVDRIIQDGIIEQSMEDYVVDEFILQDAQNDNNRLIFDNSNVSFEVIRLQMQKMLDFMQLDLVPGMVQYNQFYHEICGDNISFSGILMTLDMYQDYIKRSNVDKVYDLHVKGGLEEEFNSVSYFFASVMADLNHQDIYLQLDISASIPQKEIIAQENLNQQNYNLNLFKQYTEPQQIRNDIARMDIQEDIKKQLQEIILDNSTDFQLQEAQQLSFESFQRQLQQKNIEHENNIRVLQNEIQTMYSQIENSQRQLQEQDARNQFSQQELIKQITQKEGQIQELQISLSQQQQDFQNQMTTVQVQLNNYDNRMQAKQKQLEEFLNVEQSNFGIEKVRTQQLQAQLLELEKQNKIIIGQNRDDRESLIKQNNDMQKALKIKISEANQLVEVKLQQISELNNKIGEERAISLKKEQEIQKLQKNIKGIQDEMQLQIQKQQEQEIIVKNLRQTIIDKDLREQELKLQQIENEKIIMVNNNLIVEREAQIQKLESEVKDQVEIFRQIEEKKLELENKMRINSKTVEEIQVLQLRIKSLEEEKGELEKIISEQSVPKQDPFYEQQLQMKIIQGREALEQITEKEMLIMDLEDQRNKLQLKFIEDMEVKSQEVQQIRLEIQELDFQLEGKKTIIEALEKQKVDLVEKNQELLTQIKNLNQELNQIKIAFNSEKIEWDRELKALQGQLDLSKNKIPDGQVKLNKQLMEIIQASLQRVQQLEPDVQAPVEEIKDEVGDIFLRYRQANEEQKAKLIQEKQKLEQENFLAVEDLNQKNSLIEQLNKKVKQSTDMYNQLFERLRNLESLEADQRLKIGELQKINDLFKNRDLNFEIPVQPQLEQIVVQQVNMAEYQPVAIPFQQQPEVEVEDFKQIYLQVNELLVQIQEDKKIIIQLNLNVKNQEEEIKRLQNGLKMLEKMNMDLKDDNDGMSEIIFNVRSILELRLDPYEMLNKLFSLFKINYNVDIKKPSDGLSEMQEKYNALVMEMDFLRNEHARLQMQIKKDQIKPVNIVEERDGMPKYINDMLLKYRELNLGRLTKNKLDNAFDIILKQFRVPIEMDLNLSPLHLELFRKANRDQLMALFSLWDYKYFKQLFQSDFIQGNVMNFMNYLMEINQRFQNNLEGIIGRKKAKAKPILNEMMVQTEDLDIGIKDPMVKEKDQKIAKNKFFSQGFGQIEPYYPIVEPLDKKKRKGVEIGVQVGLIPELDYDFKPLPKVERKLMTIKRYIFDEQVKPDEKVIELKVVPGYNYFNKPKKPKSRIKEEVVPINGWMEGFVPPFPVPDIKKKVKVKSEAIPQYFPVVDFIPGGMPRPKSPENKFKIPDIAYQVIADVMPEPMVEALDKPQPGDKSKSKPKGNVGPGDQDPREPDDPEDPEKPDGGGGGGGDNPNPNPNPNPPPGGGRGGDPGPDKEDPFEEEEIEQEEDQIQQTEPARSQIQSSFIEPSDDPSEDMESVIDQFSEKSKISQSFIESVVTSIVSNSKYENPLISDAEDSEPDGDAAEYYQKMLGQVQNDYRKGQFSNYSGGNLYDLYYLLLRVRQILHKEIKDAGKRKDDKRLRVVNTSIKIVKSNINYQLMIKKGKGKYF